MRGSLPRFSRAEFIKGLIPLTAVLATGCAAQSQASPAGSPPSPVPPAALATVAPTAGAGVAGQAAATTGPQVTIDNFSFTPATITIPAGTALTWSNHDDTPHTVTAADKSFGSAAILPNTQFSYTFNTPGTYSYFCSIHPFMTAKVIVQ
jgi:plastocyanin